MCNVCHPPFGMPDMLLDIFASKHNDFPIRCSVVKSSNTPTVGCMQVLCFSDTRDQYSQEAQSEDTASLTRRLTKLDEELKVSFVCLTQSFNRATLICL